MTIKHASSKKSQQAWELVTGLQEYFKVKLSEVFEADTQEFAMVYWLRDAGLHGGGQRQEATTENYFNRASINVSQVQYEDDDSKRLQAATALSTIIHPKSPSLPSVHMHFSWTEMKTGKGYWRLMADLNPSIPNPIDRDFFLEHLRVAARSYFDIGRQQGDQYFYIPALQRHRGVAHFYLENFNSSDFKKDHEFTHDFAKTMMNCYTALLSRTLLKPQEDRKEDKKLQLEYHTVYFLQVLTLDRGTTSGLLVHDQNDVGTLGSIPSHIDRDKLLEWLPHLPSPQDELLKRLIETLPKSSPTFVSASVKKDLACRIREFYNEFPEALALQAKGFVVPETVENHTKL